MISAAHVFRSGNDNQLLIWNNRKFLKLGGFVISSHDPTRKTHDIYDVAALLIPENAEFDDDDFVSIETMDFTEVDSANYMYVALGFPEELATTSGFHHLNLNPISHPVKAGPTL